MKRAFIQAFGTSFIFAAAVTGPASAGGTAVTINEIRIDMPGDDNDEYFELAGSSGFSLDDLFYIVIGDGATGSGTVEAVIDLAGLFIPADGYFLAAESTFTLDPPQVDLTTDINFENSDNVTHVLVSGFSGANGDDLDFDDDGVLDSMPWSDVLDAISLVEDPGGGDHFYGSKLGGVDVGPDGSFVPAHVFRFPNNTGPWNIGAFDLSESNDTPGIANTPAPGALALLGIAGLAARRRRRA